MLDALNYINAIGIIALAIWLVIRLRTWARSDSGLARLAGWGPFAILSAHGAIATVWVLTAGTSPWSFFWMYQNLGGWSILPMRLILAALLILLPAGVVVIDATWLRLHLIPPSWTLPRIWATGLLVWILATAAALAVKGTLTLTLFAIVTFASPVITLFLTVWWFKSHPARQIGHTGR
jgi:hypothetical protein